MRRVVVVGASSAGLAVVETLRRDGFDGELTLVGEEAHAPYDRPPLSKQLLAGEWQPERLRLRSRDDLDALGLDLRLGSRAAGLDDTNRVVELASGERLEYDGLVIATGVRPRTLPGGGGRVLRTIDDALALRAALAPGRDLLVVGAGFLGAEVSAVARSLGCRVTLVEPAPVPLAHAIGAAVGRRLFRAHVEHGVDVRTGTSVVELRDGDALLSDGEVVRADQTVVAIGSRPATDWLTGSGLTLQDGVVCDEYCEAAPGVYAAGDVARWRNPVFGTSMRIEHRTNASEQGMAVARNLLGARRPFAPVPYFWSDQYELRLQAYGYLRGHDQVDVVSGDLGSDQFVVAYRTGDRLSGVLACNTPPKALRPWRAALARSSTWEDAVPEGRPTVEQEGVTSGAAN
jgi:NADPH-dependent 2,4-dienoyl-CoA reductase/sulfur reductase-like enzyme